MKTKKKVIKKSINSLYPVKSSVLSDTSRRLFLESGAISIFGLFLSGLSASCSHGTSSNLTNNINKIIDYGRSYYCNKAEFNSVRMWIESRTMIINEKTGNKHVYYQGASCKSENTFAEKDLFHKDNYDFLPVFGDEKVLVFRRYIKKDNFNYRYRTIADMENMWGTNPDIYTPTPEFITELDTWEKIRDATAAGIPIVSRTEFSDENTGLKAIIECPVKTMNISHPKKMYQVDTGPVAFPDIFKNYDVQIDCLNLAFIAFNTSHFTDFIIETETPVFNESKEITTVYHYSKRLSLKANNKLFALAKV